MKTMTRLTLTIACLWLSFPVHADGAQPEKLSVVLRSATVFVGDGNGARKGFDVDLLEMFVSWYGRQSDSDVTYVAKHVTMVPELLDEVRAGHCDLAIGSITITEERDRTVDFSTPYLPLRSVVISKRGAFPQGREGRLETLLQNKTVGAVVGTTHEAIGNDLTSRVSGLELDVDFETQAALFDALTASDPPIDAAITDITHFWTMTQVKDVELVEPVGPPQGLGFVLPEGSPMKPHVDEFLSEIRSTNTYFNLIERYFGVEAATMIRSSRESASR